MLHSSDTLNSSQEIMSVPDIIATCSEAIFLSPHLDDAVLSCGATVAGLVDSGVDSRVLTLFAGHPNLKDCHDIARAFHEMCGLKDDAVAVRRAEDQVAVSILGAHPVHIPLLDCVYRTHSSGGPRITNFEQIRGTGPINELDLIETVAAAIASQIAPSGTPCIFAPLGIGGHVDHRIVRMAVEKLAELLPGRIPRVFYYEDQPYAAWSRVGHQVGPGRPWVATPAGKHWRAKVRAVAAYRSQVSMLWPDVRRMKEDLLGYAVTVGDGLAAERYWGQ